MFVLFCGGVVLFVCCVVVLLFVGCFPPRVFVVRFFLPFFDVLLLLWCVCGCVFCRSLFRDGRWLLVD